MPNRSTEIGDTMRIIVSHLRQQETDRWKGNQANEPWRRELITLLGKTEKLVGTSLDEQARQLLISAAQQSAQQVRSQRPTAAQQQVNQLSKEDAAGIRAALNGEFPFHGTLAHRVDGKLDELSAHLEVARQQKENKRPATVTRVDQEMKATARRIVEGLEKFRQQYHGPGMAMKIAQVRLHESELKKIMLYIDYRLAGRADFRKILRIGNDLIRQHRAQLKEPGAEKKHQQAAESFEENYKKQLHTMKNALYSRQMESIHQGVQQWLATYEQVSKPNKQTKLKPPSQQGAPLNALLEEVKSYRPAGNNMVSLEKASLDRLMKKVADRVESPRPTGDPLVDYTKHRLLEQVYRYTNSTERQLKSDYRFHPTKEKLERLKNIRQLNELTRVDYKKLLGEKMKAQQLVSTQSPTHQQRIQ